MAWRRCGTRRRLLALAVGATLARRGHARRDAAQPTAAAPLDGPRTPAEVRDYWTPERMRDAVPIRPLAAPSPRPSAVARSPSRCAGATQAEPQPRQGLLHPRRHRLRLLGHRGQGAPRRTSSGPPGTASYGATGLAARQGFASNFEFVPAYRNGKAPFGEWPRPNGGLQATPQWKQSSQGCLPASDLRRRRTRLRRRQRREGRRQNAPGHASAAAGSTSTAQRDQRPTRPSATRQAAPFDGEKMFACRSRLQGQGLRSGQPAADADPLRHDGWLQRRWLDRRAARSPRSSPTATRASRTTCTGRTRAPRPWASSTRSRTVS